MCGIFGVWEYEQPINVQNVITATNTLHHRGPDDEGYLLVNSQQQRAVACGGQGTDPRLNLPSVMACQTDTFDLALGFRRLAILDLSPAGHQPMASPNGRYWIVFNGEIYNYLELRDELRGYGHTFTTETDTEVILAAYEQWGVECLARFNGMWALAVWDGWQRELLLARDRFGVKPLYYVHNQVHFAFASEIKALVGSHGHHFEPEQRAIYQYLVNDRLPSPQSGGTFFSGVQALPPGHWLRVGADGAIGKYRYYTLHLATSENCRSRSADDIVAAYRELFIDAVRLRLRADVPIGTCLSGGLDSSSIVGVINRLMINSGLPLAQIGQRQKTFSAVYTNEARYNERPYIEKVLADTGAEGNLIFPTLEQLQEELVRLVWHQEEPFGTTSIFAQWCVMRKVRNQGVTVLLDGQGADEALAGYRPFGLFLADLLRQAKLGQLLSEVRELQSTTGLSNIGLIKGALLRQLPWQWRSQLGHYQQLEQQNIALLNPAFVSYAQAAQWLNQPNPDREESLSHHLLTLLQETRLPHLLRYEDRNSMAFGVEARVPFLDYRLVEFSFQQASSLRIHQGWTKWVLRKAMEGIVPAELVWRKDKVGFETPQHEWLTGLAPYYIRWLEDHAESAGYINTGAVRQQLPLLLSDSYPDPGFLWRLLNLELWLRVWQQSATPASKS